MFSLEEHSFSTLKLNLKLQHDHSKLEYMLSLEVPFALLAVKNFQPQASAFQPSTPTPRPMLSIAKKGNEAICLFHALHLPDLCTYLRGATGHQPWDRGLHTQQA